MKKVFLACLTAGMLVAGNVANSNGSPIQWTVKNGGNGHFYEVVETSLSWSDAKDASEASTLHEVYGYLATVTSASENQFITELLADAGLGEYWIGGFQPDGSIEPDGNWQWVTTEEFAYTNWNSSEPNNFLGDGGPENYLVIRNLSGMEGNWNDQYGVELMVGYVVEYAVPIPSGFILLGSAIVGVVLLLRKNRIQET